MSRSNIRLLAVLLPDDSGKIKCRLQEFALSEAPSYTWGKLRRDTNTIECDGLPMRIGNSLWDFLDIYQFRAKPGAWTWVDAICIGQSDVKERNHQGS
jgi:hypothetical protein